MKWLPPPSVPTWRAARSCRSWTPVCRSPKPFQNASQPPTPYTLAGFTGVLCSPKPTGTYRSMRLRSGPRSSGRSDAVSDVRTALIPQPMSTPTAAGDTASRIAITLPTVAPFP